MNTVISIIYFIVLSIASLLAGLTAQQKELDEKVKSFYGLEALPPKYQRGFIYQFAVRQIYDQLSPQEQETFQKMFAVPERQASAISPSGRFILHYDTTGFHAVITDDILSNGIPDFIDSAGVFLDYSWQVQIDQLGYQQPIDINGNPAGNYNIYFTRLSTGSYGVTTWLDPGQSNDRYASYIEMDNTFSSSALFTNGLEALKVTCAHELHHAIQLSYRLRGSDIFFFEMTSSWMEEIVYPEVNDYFQYLPYIYGNYTINGLNKRDGISEYGNALYLHMLSGLYGNDVVKEIWEQIPQQEAISAINTVMQGKGSSFAGSFNDYAKWMYFSGERALPTFFFAEADSYPTISINNDLIFSGDENFYQKIRVRPYTFNYFKAENIKNLRTIIKAKPDSSVTHIRLNFFNENTLESIPVNGNNGTQIILDQSGQDMVIAVSNSSNYADSVYFSFIVDELIIPDSSDHNPIAFGPNPVVLNDIPAAYFFAVPPQQEIIIMNINQKPVRILKNYLNMEARLEWDLKDSDGRLLKSGIYFYVFQHRAKTKVGKIAVVR
jgi:hypothetical protein